MKLTGLERFAVAGHLALSLGSFVWSAHFATVAWLGWLMAAANYYVAQVRRAG